MLSRVRLNDFFSIWIFIWCDEVYWCSWNNMTKNLVAYLFHIKAHWISFSTISLLSLYWSITGGKRKALTNTIQSSYCSITISWIHNLTMWIYINLLTHHRIHIGSLTFHLSTIGQSKFITVCVHYWQLVRMVTTCHYYNVSLLNHFLLIFYSISSDQLSMFFLSPFYSIPNFFSFTPDSSKWIDNAPFAQIEFFIVVHIIFILSLLHTWKVNLDLSSVYDRYLIIICQNRP